MRVLVTRPLADASDLAASLEALGHEIRIEPLLDISINPGPDITVTGFQALALTSANGARAAASRIPDHDIPVFAVGTATASKARALGFAHVSESSGVGVTGLVDHIRASTTAAAGPLLHVTSGHTAGDLQGSLQAHGFRVETLAAYTASASTAFSETLQQDLRTNTIAAAMFFSPRSAAIFVALARQHKLEDTCENIAALALSPNVATSLRPLMFRKLLVAQNTTTAAMLELLATV